MPKKSVHKKVTKDGGFKKHLVYLCSCCSLVILLSLASFNLNLYLREQKVLGTSTENSDMLKIQEEKTFWENFLAKNPTYLDGWLELARIEASLGDKNYALGALNTARAINPNSQKVIETSKAYFNQN